MIAKEVAFITFDWVALAFKAQFSNLTSLRDCFKEVEEASISPFKEVER